MAPAAGAGGGVRGGGSQHRASFSCPGTLGKSLSPLLQGRFYDSLLKMGKLRFRERKKLNM